MYFDLEIKRGGRKRGRERETKRQTNKTRRDQARPKKERPKTSEALYKQESPRFPLKGSFKGYIDTGIDIVQVRTARLASCVGGGTSLTSGLAVLQEGLLEIRPVLGTIYTYIHIYLYVYVHM